jgi:peroxiredoxin Q/BCP
MLREGDRVPHFDLQDQDGARITDADLKGRTVVLYFYPKDDTPGCTKEACAFRDGFDAFRERGAEIVGVSPDDVASHAAFRTKYRLPFRLVADPQHTLAEAFGVWGEQEWKGQKYLGVTRATFILVDGQVTQVYPQVDVMGHAERVLADLPSPFNPQM